VAREVEHEEASSGGQRDRAPDNRTPLARDERTEEGHYAQPDRGHAEEAPGEVRKRRDVYEAREDHGARVEEHMAADAVEERRERVCRAHGQSDDPRKRVADGEVGEEGEGPHQRTGGEDGESVNLNRTHQLRAWFSEVAEEFLVEPCELHAAIITFMVFWRDEKTDHGSTPDKSTPGISERRSRQCGHLVVCAGRRREIRREIRYPWD